MAQPYQPSDVKAFFRRWLKPTPPAPPRSIKAEYLADGIDQMIDMLSVNTWAPVFGLVTDGLRLVIQIVDWTGGLGPKPNIGEYIGTTGRVTNIADAVSIRGIQGPKGWSPLLQLESTPPAAGTWIEGIVLKVVDWTGGEGNKPSLGYVGATGIVSDVSQATNVRGSSWFASDTVPLDLGAPGAFGQRGDLCLHTLTGDVYRCELGTGRWILKGNLRGIPGLNWRGAWVANTVYAVGDVVATGGSAYVRKVAGSSGSSFSGVGANWDSLVSKGDKGDQGYRGWTQIAVLVSDGNRIVRQVIDYIGGEGPKPTDYIGQYITSTGFTTNIALGLDVRGPQGIQGIPGTLTVSALTDIAPLATDKLVYQRADGSLGKSDSSTGYPATRPTLLLDFAGAGLVSQAIQHTRSGVLSYFDKLGIMRFAPANVPAIEYDPVTGKCLGLSIWEARTNLISYSEDQTNIVWGAGTFVTRTAGLPGSPANTSTVTKIVEDTTLNTHRAFEIIIPAAGFNTNYTFSIYVKGAGRTRCKLYTIGSGNTVSHNTTFDLTGSGSLTNGTVGTITAVANGWYRITGNLMTGAPSNSPGWRIELDNGTGTAYTGDGVSGLLTWGGQIEQGTFATPYIPTTTGPVSRGNGTHYLDLLSAWFRQGQGTIYLESQTNATQINTSALDLWQDNNNKISVRISQVLVASTGGGGSSGGAPAGSLQRLAFRYTAGDTRVFRNGVSVSGPVSPTIPAAFTKMYLGITDITLYWLNGYVRTVRYYPALLTDAELTAITSY